MSKRKAGVNDIIYELDNDDIELSSDDEVKEAKINRLDTATKEDIAVDEDVNDVEISEVATFNLIVAESSEKASPSKTNNGGKSTSDTNTSITNDVDSIITYPSAEGTVAAVDTSKKNDADCSKTTIFNDDIVVDSPASNSDLGVVGCENRTPLVTVRFRDKKLASTYKQKLKTFMLRLIRLHEKESSSDLDSETDIELDIWPEDLNDDEDFDNESENDVQDSLFFVDTDPCSNVPDEIPTYKNVSKLISNQEAKEASPPPVLRRGPTCFNCDGAHPLRDCTLTKNHARIAEKRKNMTTRVGRYHVEDDQRYGHLIPGRISGQLRHALGLKRHELPPHIYRMRVLGYPPGWLEEARISHSGITMFDSTGTAILDPEEEEGEVCEPGSKDKFDIKKILDFPGFNVPASSRYLEEGHLYGMPPPAEQDSKIAMLQMLAPNAMKAYKRKKLALFPSAANNSAVQEVAEMDLDSGDEIVEFPSVPPLPDDAPPALPPPPAGPPPPPPPPAGPPPPPPPAPVPAVKVASADDTADDIEVVEVIKVRDIPVPEVLSITIDDDDVDEKAAKEPIGRDSPSLDDLEEKKRQLLNALEGDEVASTVSTEPDQKHDQTISLEEIEAQLDEALKSDHAEKANLSNAEAIDSNDEDVKEIPDKETLQEDMKEENKTDEKVIDESLDEEKLLLSDTDLDNEKPPADKDSAKEEATTNAIAASTSTPESKAGHVKTTLYGTPVMNTASPYEKLPSDDKFAKDICDVINFENLPNSTGKYKKICNILKRVKNEVDRIQES